MCECEYPDPNDNSGKARCKNPVFRCRRCSNKCRFCEAHLNEPKLCTICEKGPKIRGRPPSPSSSDSEGDASPAVAIAHPGTVVICEEPKRCEGWWVTCAQELYWDLRAVNQDDSKDVHEPKQLPINNKALREYRLTYKKKDQLLRRSTRKSRETAHESYWYKKPLLDFLNVAVRETESPTPMPSGDNPYGRLSVDADWIGILCDPSMHDNAIQIVINAMEKYASTSVVVSHKPIFGENVRLETQAPRIRDFPGRTSQGEACQLHSINPLGFLIYTKGVESTAAEGPVNRLGPQRVGQWKAPTQTVTVYVDNLTGNTIHKWLGRHRGKSQRTVMGYSAADHAEYHGFAKREEPSKTGRKKTVLEWEWLHLIAHSMGGPTHRTFVQGNAGINADEITIPTNGLTEFAELNPQVPWNLGLCGTRAANSAMLILEAFIERELTSRRAQSATLAVTNHWLDAPYSYIGTCVDYMVDLKYDDKFKVRVRRTFNPRVRTVPMMVEMMLQNRIQNAMVKGAINDKPAKKKSRSARIILTIEEGLAPLRKHAFITSYSL